jgi:ribosomal protein S18 acetylase RimI-like enzyme
MEAGETYTWNPDVTEDDARRAWMHETSPGRTFVAIDSDDAVLGTAEMHPNQAGPGSHVANAGFVINSRYAGRGVGRTLAEHVLEQARNDGYLAMQFNAVVETNTRAIALWRSLGFRIVGTVPEAFLHPLEGYVSLHIMHRRL